MSSSCHVILRVRPLALAEEAGGRCLACAPRSVAVQASEGGGRDFAFDTVLGEASGQEDVWAAVSGVASSVLDGYTAALLVYGQSGTGKTFTMVGGGEGEGGLVQRAAELLCAAEGEARTVSLSIVEVYQERVKDLLASGRDNLQVLDGPDGAYVAGVTLVSVASAADVSVQLRAAGRARAVCATGLNAASSRSHLLVSLALGGSRRGKLLLVDLAGSERLSRTGAAGAGLAEAKSINKSLSALGRVIAARTSGCPPAAVPYRDSKLTRLLREALSGSAALSLILCASPAAADSFETVSTLRFGARAKTMALAPVAAAAAPDEAPDAVAVAAMQAELQELRETLRARDAELAELLRRMRAAEAAAEAAAEPAAVASVAASGGGSAREAGWIVLTWALAVASTRRLPALEGWF